jgi:glycyl-tRNA synthetase
MRSFWPSPLPFVKPVFVAQDHPKFESIQQLKPLLFSQELQTNETKQPEAMSLGDAVTNKIIANQTLAYFIGRTYLFLVSFVLL